MKKVLLLVKLPPPITGATIMNKMVVDSPLLQNEFDLRTLALSYTKENSDLGRFSLTKLFKFTKYLMQFRNLLKEFQPDLVYFQISLTGGGFLRDCLFVWLVRVHHVQIIYHLHSMGLVANYRSWKKKLYRWAFQDSEIIHLTKRSASDIPVAIGSTVHILPNTIPDRQVQKVKPSETLKLLFLSNLMMEKGIADLLEVATILKERSIKFDLSIIGKEHDISIGDLQSSIIEKGLKEQVKVLGPQYGGNKNKILDESDLLIFPSSYHKEVFPLVILEAMQAGVVTIAYDHAGISEVVQEGITGFLAPKKDFTSMSDKIVWLSQNSSKLEHMSQQSMSVFQSLYRYESFEKNIAVLLEKVINNTNP